MPSIVARPASSTTAIPALADDNLDQSNKSSTFDGWTAGGGLEYLVNPAWSIKGEYLHFDFGNQTVQFTGGENWGNKLTVDTVKFGVNYHVGGRGYEPLK